MAHAARLADLVTGLVTNTTSIDIGHVRHKQLTGTTLARIRPTNHARVNQFAVKSTLEGLVEKFAVLNRDDLAEALQSRLNELSLTTGWMPEILSLLLSLSDRPLEKTSLQTLHDLRSPSTKEEPPAWHDDHSDTSDDELWANIERGYHSSGDDASQTGEDTDPTVSTVGTSSDDVDPELLARELLIVPSQDLLQSLKTHHKLYRDNTDQSCGYMKLSESDLARQLLVLVAGTAQETDISVMPFELGSASKASIRHICSSFVHISRSLNVLRRWTSLQQSVPFIRSIQASISASLTDLQLELAKIEQRYMLPSKDCVASIITLETTVASLVRPLVRLSMIVEDYAKHQNHQGDFTLLDRFYDEACIAQVSADDAVYLLCQRLFVAGLRVYLRPATVWMQSGSLPSIDNSPFFVESLEANCPPQDVWHKRYHLKLAADGSARAPKCLAQHVQTVFATGKARMMSNMLAHASPDTSNVAQAAGDNLEFRTVATDSNSFLPFSIAVAQALNHWLDKNTQDRSFRLSARLMAHEETFIAMEVMPYIYFGRDGIAFRQFVNAISRNIHSVDTATSGDAVFVLTELAQSTLGDCPHVDLNNISAELEDGVERSVTTSLTKKIGCVRLHYELPWTLQNVTRCRHSICHAEVTALLLQVQHSASQLDSQLCGLRDGQTFSMQALQLRHALLCLCNVIMSHITSTAGHLHRDLLDNFRLAKDLDAMVAIWSEHERRLRINFLLTSNLQPLKSAILQLLQCCEIVALTTRKSAAESMQDQFRQTVQFLVTGLRAVSRAGGELALETLADRLGWLIVP